MKKIEIGEKSKVNIKWNVRPVDYSHEGEDSIIAKFASKYGISKANIQVEPVFIVKKEDGSDAVVTDGIIGNAQDPKFHQVLFKEYLTDNEITDVSFDDIVEIDEVINAEMDYELYEKRKKYAVKWIKWSNFMSYGKNNFFDFTKLSNLVLLTSEPANQGGKSTFCLDLLRFLLFGKVTLREDDWTLAKVFNRYRPEETEVIVEGCICIDGEDYVIKRVVSRPQLKKRTEKSKVSQTLSYYKLVNGEYIELEDEENMEGDTQRDTNKLIKEAIGNERNFDLMICVNSDNLKKLISLKDTERGRLITRWIGLLPLEEKDKLARERFNTVIMKQLLSNKYNKGDLQERNTSLAKDNEDYTKAVKVFKKQIKDNEQELANESKTRDTLLVSKNKIDDNLMKVDVKTVEAELVRIKDEGVKKRAEEKESKEKLEKYKDLTFDENQYTELEEKCSKLGTELALLREKAKSLQNDIKNLKNGEYCPTCGAKLKNVDNSKAIQEKEKALKTLVEDGKKKAAEHEKATKEKAEMAVKRGEYNEKMRLGLIIEKVSVDIEILGSKYKENKRILKDISDNEESIRKNAEIDASLNLVNEKIRLLNNTIKGINEQIAANNEAIKLNEKTIGENNKIIEVLEKEEKIIRNWRVYLDMVGKNGVCKTVLRKALPFINGELKSMLNGVCDFDVKVVIDNHNDVTFLLCHNGVEGGLGSGSGFEQTVASLALRCVLSKISSFSKPSFVVFDEILGGVADENYEQLKLLYDKIAKDYAFILQISHIKGLYEWHNHFIKVKKVDDVSVIENEL